jgi:hypothetical protein
MLASGLTLLTACGSPPAGPPLPYYHCEHQIGFTVRFVDDAVVLDSTRGYEILYRPEGSKSRLYRNIRMSAEFGLGASGQEALLRYPLLPLAARCARD